MKKLALILLAPLSLLMTSCESEVSSSTDLDQAKKTERMLAEANRQVDMPNIVHFQQKKMLKMIFELSDQENLICHAYLQNSYSGKLIYVGRCMGFGIPFSAQFTNPMRIVDGYEFTTDYAGTQPMAIPQADPNGLFLPTTSSATWLIMLDENNEPRPVYFEPTIVVSPFKLTLGVEG